MRSSSSTEDEEDESGAVQMGPWHATLLEAYKLDGSFLWRVALGPNVPVGNLTSFAVYDLMVTENVKLRFVPQKVLSLEMEQK